MNAVTLLVLGVVFVTYFALIATLKIGKIHKTVAFGLGGVLLLIVAFSAGVLDQSVPEELGGAKSYSEINAPVRDANAQNREAPVLEGQKRDYLNEGREALNKPE